MGAETEDEQLVGGANEQAFLCVRVSEWGASGAAQGSASVRELLQLTGAYDPLVWVQGQRCIVGAGRRLRFTATGEERFAQLSAVWEQLRQKIVVLPEENPEEHLAHVGASAGGRKPTSALHSPLAFAVFSFADASFRESALIIAEHTLVLEDGKITHVHALFDGETTELAPQPFTAWQGVQLEAEPDEASRDSYLKTVTPLIDVLNGNVQEVADSHTKLQKVVIARRLHADLPSGADLRVPLARLWEQYPECFTFAVDGTLGASPETLVQLRDAHVRTLVLAGTAARVHEDPAADARNRDELLCDETITREHRFAAESVAERLEDALAEIEFDTGEHVIGLVNVWHRATEMRGQLREEMNAIDLASLLHPTAAVAGTPRATALRVIAALEEADRGRYAGAVGWIDTAGDGEFAVTLRCADVQDSTITAWAGGGIVAGTNPEKELAETVLKFAPIVDAFAAVEAPNRLPAPSAQHQQQAHQYGHDRARLL